MEARRFVLHPVAGPASQIGLALSAMEEVREQLRKVVQGLSVEEMARLAVPGAHSIGALVLHIGEAEWYWINCVIKGHELTDEDRCKPYWDVLKEPGAFAVKNYSSGFCLNAIQAVREETRGFLASLDDEALETVYRHTRGEDTIEPNLRWILHHLVDHEAQHKGQILMLKRLIGSKRDADLI